MLDLQINNGKLVFLLLVRVYVHASYVIGSMSVFTRFWTHTGPWLTVVVDCSCIMRIRALSVVWCPRTDTHRWWISFSLHRCYCSLAIVPFYVFSCVTVAKVVFCVYVVFDGFYYVNGRVPYWCLFVSKPSIRSLRTILHSVLHCLCMHHTCRPTGAGSSLVCTHLNVVDYNRFSWIVVYG